MFSAVEQDKEPVSVAGHILQSGLPIERADTFHLNLDRLTGFIIFMGGQFGQRNLLAQDFLHNLFAVFRGHGFSILMIMRKISRQIAAVW